jgi:uncharacterized protein (TIGR00730 family)
LKPRRPVAHVPRPAVAQRPAPFLRPAPPSRPASASGQAPAAKPAPASPASSPSRPSSAALSSPASSWAAARDAAISDFLDRFADSPDRDLLAEIMVTITRLAREHTDRGDIKLLTSAFKELRYAFKVFAPYAGVRKVSIFGSSRTPPDHPDYIQAEAFAALMRERHWMVITGAGEGIMGAGQRGAGRSGSFGVAIRLPHEQRTNEEIAADPKLITFKHFFTRKILFLKEASAICLFPGGFGTHDEGFEALTMVQTGKTSLIPIVLVDAPGGTYWQHWRTYIKAELLHNGMIGEEDMNLFKLTDDITAAADEITGFYRRYHSMRYVGPQLILRLTSPVPTAALEKLNDKYCGIVNAGRIEQCAGPVEGEDGEFPDLWRLTLQFNRKNVATLRLMVNEINST